MSGNLKLIKRRIRSAKNIGQITKAMQMVAASKMRKAQKKALDSAPYNQKIYDMTNSLMERVSLNSHPLLSVPENDFRPLIILISTNRGLCASLNLNLFRKLTIFLTENNIRKDNFDFISLGKKGLNFIARISNGLLADFSDVNPWTEATGLIVKAVEDQFIAKKNSSVYLIYNSFINSLKQEPVSKKILPFISKDMQIPKMGESSKPIHLIEPSPKEVLDFLIPFYLESQVREAIFQAEASEHSARMLAMKNATDNALELVGGLTLEYNKARQQAITTEISDIVTAKISMEST